MYQSPEITEILQRISVSDYESLIKDEDALNDYAEDIQSIKSNKKSKEEMLKYNKELAEQNLRLKPEFEELQNKLISAYENLNLSKDKFSNLKSQIESHKSKYSLSNVIDLLKVATMKAEEESDDYGKQFMAGSMDVDAFLSQYIKARKLYHDRRIKSEKLVKQQISASSDTASIINPVVPSIPYRPPYPNAAPFGYPMMDPSSSRPPYPFS